MSEHTPFIADEDHGEEGQIRLGDESRLPANSYFRRPLKVLNSLSSVLSLLLFGLFIGTHIYLNVAPLESNYQQTYRTQNLAISLLITTILTAPTIFIALPILIPLVANLTMSIFSLILGIDILTSGWPDSYMCRRYRRYPDYTLEPELPACIEARQIVRILFAVGSGCTILLGLLLLVIAIIRMVALVKSRFWAGKSFPSLTGWKNPTGFTIQLSLSILPSGTLPVVVGTTDAVEAPVEERERLIEA